MLQGLRRSAGSWVVKALMGLLVLSFAVWGIADIFTGYRGTAVATVGNTEIDGEEFRQKFQNEIRIQSRQLGRPIGYGLNPGVVEGHHRIEAVDAVEKADHRRGHRTGVPMFEQCSEQFGPGHRDPAPVLRRPPVVVAAQPM